MKPLLKWAGGKHLLAPKISEAFGSSDPEKTIYHEPFLGAGSVFLLRRSKGEVYRAVLSDINPKLIGFHKAVQTHVDDVLKALDSLPKEDWKEHYYEVRETFNEKPPKVPNMQPDLYGLIKRVLTDSIAKTNRESSMSPLVLIKLSTSRLPNTLNKCPNYLLG